MLGEDEASLLSLFSQMVQLDSESGEEKRFITFVADLVADGLGGSASLDKFGNLVCRVPARGSASNKSVLLAAHADTVCPGKGIVPRVSKGVVASSGPTVLGADDKAGILEILVALAQAARRPQVEVLITREEELGLRGSRHLERGSLTAKIGFVVDLQALDKIVVGGPRHYFLDVIVTGRGAHAGVSPEKGVSAIKTAALAIARLPDGRVDAETTCNIGIIQGGVARNVVPDSVRIVGECRSLLDRKADELVAMIETRFREAGSATGATVQVVSDMQYPAYHIPEEALPVRVACRALESSGIVPRVVSSTGATDAVFLNAQGIQTVAIGFGGRNAHTTEETIALADMATAVTTIRRILEELA